MRILYSVAFIIILITILTTFSYRSIQNTSSNIHNFLVTMNKDTYNNNWVQIEKTNQQLDKEWKKAQQIFPVFLDHAEMHDLEIALARISSLIKHQNKNKLQSEISVAKRLVINIQNQEKLSLRNIL